MNGPSILWPSGETGATPGVEPAFFRDLNLDQIVASIVAGKGEYDLEPLLRQPLGAIGAIEYRQAAMRDVQREEILWPLRAFAAALHDVRDTQAQGAKLYYKLQKDAWLLDAADAYCGAAQKLEADLGAANPRSGAFVAFRDFLSGYVASPSFRTLLQDIVAVRNQLNEIRYTLRIGSGWVTVAPYREQADYESEIDEDFSRFKQGDVKTPKFGFPNSVQMNHIEAGIVDRIARFFPDAFAALDAFARQHAGFAHPTIIAFDREAQFYLAYHEYISRLTAKGLKFCFPIVVHEKGNLRARGIFDLALANIVMSKDGKMVTNEFHLSGQERMIIVSGPNQGGKTTFARTFGQLHYLASLGLPVPGDSATLFKFDQIYTHFETEEDLHNLRGKLHDDLFRLHETLAVASSDSIVILNEVFNSTSLKDAIFLSSEILKAVLDLDALCVCVTFVDELASLSTKIVSMASTVKPDDTAERTFNIVRKPPDGLAYALSIAEKHGLTYPQLQERLAP
jgi:DNA mismatch repair protein MutS